MFSHKLFPKYCRHFSKETKRQTLSAVVSPKTNWTLFIRQALGFSGYLEPKYAISPALVQAQLQFLNGPPPASSKCSKDSSTPHNNDVWVSKVCFEELCGVMGNCWAGSSTTAGEPMKEWMTSHVEYPDQETKVLLATYYMGSSIAQAMRTNSIVFGRSINGHVVSVVIVSQHDDVEQSDKAGQIRESNRSWMEEANDFWWELGVTVRLSCFTIPNVFGCLMYQNQQSRSAAKAAALGNIKQAYLHESKAKRPGTYWKVQMVAVNPKNQGQGHGQELMKRLGELADIASMPCYLEAAGGRNKSFYKQMGYQVSSKLQILDPTDKNASPLNVDMMMRLPNKVPLQ